MCSNSTSHVESIANTSVLLCHSSSVCLLLSLQGRRLQASPQGDPGVTQQLHAVHQWPPFQAARWMGGIAHVTALIAKMRSDTNMSVYCT